MPTPRHLTSLFFAFAFACGTEGPPTPSATPAETNPPPAEPDVPRTSTTTDDEPEAEPPPPARDTRATEFCARWFACGGGFTDAEGMPVDVSVCAELTVADLTPSTQACLDRVTCPELRECLQLPLPEPPAASPLSCAAAECAAQMHACESYNGCYSYSRCLEDCAGTACEQACTRTFRSQGESISRFRAWASCYDTSCAGSGARPGFEREDGHTCAQTMCAAQISACRGDSFVCNVLYKWATDCFYYAEIGDTNFPFLEDSCLGGAVDEWNRVWSSEGSSRDRAVRAWGLAYVQAGERRYNSVVSCATNACQGRRFRY